MINNLKYKLSFSFSLLNKGNIRYILICLIAFNFYSSLNASPYEGFGLDLINTFGVPTYIFLLVLLIAIFTITIINNSGNKYMFFVRYRDKKEYTKSLLTNTFFLITGIYIANIIVYLIMFVISQKFMFDNLDYWFYGIKAYVYFIWLIIKTYFYLLFIGYFIIKTHVISKNKYLKYIFMLAVCFTFTIMSMISYMIPDILLKFTFYYHLGIIDYGNFGSELITYLAYFIIKIYILNFLISLLNKQLNFKKITNIKIKYFIFNMINLLNKKNITVLLIYIAINAYNIHMLYDAEYITESFVLGLANPKNLGYIMVLTLVCSIIIINFIFMNSINYDIESTSDYLFTRITKKTWIINKAIVLFLILIIFRIPLYIILNFSLGTLYDFILYTMELVFCFFFILSSEIIYKVTYAVALLIILLSDINYITCLIIGVLLFINIIYALYVRKRLSNHKTKTVK